MSQKFEEFIDIIPKKTRELNLKDDKFLFFFKPEIIGQEKVFSLLPIETGIIIFLVIVILQALSNLLGIFLPGSFFNFLYYAIFFILYGTTAFYLCLGYTKKNYLYTKVSYIIISGVFLFISTIYVLKSVFKILKFFIPFSGGFLSFDFVEYVFGKGLFLFGYLYLIYILFLFMIKLENPKNSNNSEYNNDYNFESPVVINNNENNYMIQK